MIAPARLAAYQAIRAVTGGRAQLATALANARDHLQAERDRSLTGEIVTGTFRWLGRIDHAIAQLTHRPLARLDPEVLDILRLSLYQLHHLDRVPAAAIVSDAVELTRAAGKRSASGLVNAVLRSAGLTGRDFPAPARPERCASIPDSKDREAALDYLSITLSHPRWLAARWLDRYGLEAAEAWTAFNNSRPSLTLRANRLRIGAEALAGELRSRQVLVEPTRFAPDGLTVTSGNPLATDLATSGLFVVQDEASQLVSLLAAGRPGETILDACASPGGKTTAIAVDMMDCGLIVAADVRPARVALLQRTVRRAGATCVRIVQMDLAGGLAFKDSFDCVFVDAPCSGLGVLRRDPDLKWRRSEEELAVFADVEQTLLRSAAAAVRPGGRLVYATCSSEPDENEAVVQRFLAAQPAFAAYDPRDERDTPDGLAAVLNEHGHLRTLPHVHGLEAFFGAVFRRMR